MLLRKYTQVKFIKDSELCYSSSGSENKTIYRQGTPIGLYNKEDHIEDDGDCVNLKLGTTTIWHVPKSNIEITIQYYTPIMGSG